MKRYIRCTYNSDISNLPEVSFDDIFETNIEHDSEPYMLYNLDKYAGYYIVSKSGNLYKVKFPKGTLIWNFDKLCRYIANHDSYLNLEEASEFIESEGCKALNDRYYDRVYLVSDKIIRGEFISY